MSPIRLWCQRTYWIILSTVLLAPMSWASGLPTPPSNLLPDSDKSWLDVAAALIYKLLGYACIIGGVAGCIAALGGIIKAYQTAQKEQDLGHFFKFGFLSIVALVLCLALAYAGNQILPSG